MKLSELGGLLICILLAGSSIGFILLLLAVLLKATLK